MNESLLLGLFVGGLIVAAALLTRRTPFSEVPPSVAAAIQRGEKIEAIKEYRSATGAGLKEAKEYVEEIQRRAVNAARG